MFLCVSFDSDSPYIHRLIPVFQPSQQTPQTIALWFTAIIGPTLVGLILALFAAGPGTERPSANLVLLVVGSLMAMTSTAVLWIQSTRVNSVELRYLALFVTIISLFRLMHGFLTPGVFYGPNESFSTAAFWSIPAALILTIPAAFRDHKLQRFADIRPNRWIKWSLSSVLAIGSLLLVSDGLLPTPTNGQGWVPLVIASSIFGTACFARRHMYLSIVSHSRAPLVVVAGYGLVGASSLMWLSPSPYSLSYWFGQIMAIGGALTITGGAISAYRHRNHAFTEPVVALDPRSSLELNLDPLLREFLTFLDAKDPITQQHTSGTVQLVITIGSRLDLDANKLRDVALAALLHDVGMMLIPEEILNKPTALTTKETSILQRHVNYGTDLLTASPVLNPIAPIVRAHHENVDGTGYPLGLHGNQIPPSARLLSACDAYDAMINSREYRRSASVEEALTKLEQLAGLRWDRRVVETLSRWARANPPTDMPAYLDSIGRIGCDCIPEADRGFNEKVA